MKKLLLILALWPVALFAQTTYTVTPNVPPLGFNVLAGSTRQINVQVSATNGSTVTPCGPTTSPSCTGLINWSVTGTTGGASATFTEPLQATITAYSTASNVVTLTATNSFTAGQTVQFNLATGPTYLNNLLAGYTILSAGLSTSQFEVAYTGATGSGSASGIAGLTYTASSLTNALATVQLNFGSTQGNCTYTSNPVGVTPSGPVLSTATVTVQAQSVDNTAVVGTFLINICQNAPATLPNGVPSVGIWPAYTQVYQGTGGTPGTFVDIQSAVTGCVDETGVWSQVSGPITITLPDTTYRDMVFLGSMTTGRYVFQYTANCNGGTNTAMVYVSPRAAPSYSAGPQETVAQECYPDPAMTGGDYEVGTNGEAYSTISSVPNWTSWAPGTIMRIHNDDTTGLSPTTYHEYMQVHNSGTSTQPMIVCGVPDTAGNLPIMSGNNAVTQADTDAYLGGGGYGAFMVWPGSVYQPWTSGSAGPNYVSLYNLHIMDVGPGFSFVPPAWSSTTSYGAGEQVSYSGSNYKSLATNTNVTPPSSTTDWSLLASGLPVWNAGAGCIYFASGTYFDVRGNDLDTCAVGAYTFANSSHQWGAMTQYFSLAENHITNFGLNKVDTDHASYMQSWYQFSEGNRIDNAVAGMSGSALKDRGLETIERYNYIGSGPARDIDHVDIQDGPAFMDFDVYLGGGASYEGIPANAIAWYQQSNQNSYDYGNEIYGAGQVVNQIHYFQDHNAAMAARNGVLHEYATTFDNAKEIVDNSYGGNGTTAYYQPRTDMQNNIFWPANLSGSGSKLALGTLGTFISTFGVNLFETTSMVLTTPIAGGAYNAGHATGWSNTCDGTPCPWPNITPLNPHLYNISPSNFLLTPTQPYDPPTMAPVSGSAAISACIGLTGLPSQLPVRWQYSSNINALTARTDTFYTNPTCGAVQGTPPPVLSSIAITPSSTSISTGGTQAYTGTCYYSDGTNSSCTSSLTWASSNTAIAVFNSPGQASGLVGGFVSISATIDGITSNLAGLTVVPVPDFTGPPCVTGCQVN